MCRTVAVVAAASVVCFLIYANDFAMVDDFGYHGPDMRSCDVRVAEYQTCQAAEQGGYQGEFCRDTDGTSGSAPEVASSYFEGWYFKLTTRDGGDTVALIPGVMADWGVSSRPADTCAGEAFVMVVDGKTSDPAAHYYRFSPADFSPDAPAGLDRGPRAIKRGPVGLAVGSNTFGLAGLTVALDAALPGARTDTAAPAVHGSVHLTNATRWPMTPLTPGVMGWFAWVPTMQCFHGVESMHSHIAPGSSLSIGGRTIDFSGGVAYIEKDFGGDFPRSWVWIQANSFRSHGHRIPWFGQEFGGFIMGLQHGDTLYRFATYTGARITSMAAGSTATRGAAPVGEASLSPSAGGARGSATIVVTDSRHKLTIKAEVLDDTVAYIHGPQPGVGMVRYVREALNGRVSVELRTVDGELVFEGVSSDAGVELTGNLAGLSEAAVAGPAGVLAGPLRLLVVAGLYSIARSPLYLAGIVLILLLARVCLPNPCGSKRQR